MKSMVLLFSLAVSSFLPAQSVPLQRPEERMETRRQSAEVFDAIRPVAREVSDSAVWVWARGRQVAIGTVVGDGTQILTKWSEIGINYDSIQVVGGDGRQADASVLAVYQEEDVALLQLAGAQFSPIEWSREESPPVGRFLVAPGPDDNPLGIGVVAVRERRLGAAALGVYLDRSYEGEGVLVAGVVEGGGAEAAGIKKDDRIVGIGDGEISNVYRLQALLSKYDEGETQRLKVLRDGREIELRIELSSPSMFPQFPQARLNVMRKMGGPISMVGDGFPNVIQTDMNLKPNQCGGPIVDLRGNVVGLAISRTDRTRSFILPAADVETLLGTEGLSPELAKNLSGKRQLTMGENRRPRPKAVPMNPGSADRLRRHLQEMQGLLERIDREMERIGE